MQSSVCDFIGRAIKKDTRQQTTMVICILLLQNFFIILKLILNWKVGKGVFEEF